MMRCWRWSARSMIVAPLLAVSVACGAQPLGGPRRQRRRQASSAVPRAAVGTAIDDYIAQGPVNLLGGEVRGADEIVAEEQLAAIRCPRVTDWPGRTSALPCWRWANTT